MLTKLQYFALLLVAVGVFFGAFAKFGLDNTKIEVAQEESEATPPTDIAQPNPNEVEDAFNILPTTEVLMVLKDQENNIIDSQKLDPYTIMGLNKDDLSSIFPGYQVVAFSEEQIILEGNTYIKPEEIVYYLGVDGQDIGIVLGDDGFLKIGLSVNDFSSYINTLLSHELIAVTMEERIQLENDPYYIERILQNLSE
ncbi:MAG: hypothetical protein BEN18_07980 [Epulopiscium sp. Nuni2H_MBin001]|nr:MAG: hypothetical protein BEN18_07980 [Epulopiscium sp. Nuni2H_MBin001]